MELHIDLAFFQDDDLLGRGEVCCTAMKATSNLEGTSGYRFVVTSLFEIPACQLEIECYSQNSQLYRSALRVGVHNSDDWETIDLGGIHTLGFRCRKIE